MNLDIFEQARGAVSPGLIKTIFSSDGAIGSGEQNGEWYIKSPLRNDKSVGSFSINLHTGLWKDMATDQGGDFIDLIAESHNMSKLQSAEYIIEQSGGIVDRGDMATSQPAEKKKAPKVQIPIPENDEVIGKLKTAISGEYPSKYWGNPTDIYRYRNISGEWIFSVVKFVKTSTDDDGTEKQNKSTIPYYYTDKNRWIAKRPIEIMPFPPYRVETINPELPILIVEGEKCASYPNKHLPGFEENYNIISWMGGTGRVDETDWTYIAELSKTILVIIWPDADSQMNKEKTEFLPQEQQPGWKAAKQIQAKIPRSTIMPVYKEWPIDSDPDGYDIADFVHDGGDVYQFIEDMTMRARMVIGVVPEDGKTGQTTTSTTTTPPPTIKDSPDDLPDEIPDDSYTVYRMFIDNYYSHDCLEQSAGAYWQYDDRYHYWDRVQKKDILCNMQRWVENTGIQSSLSGKTKMTTFFNEMATYINTHSNGYVNDNPFADSAVSPYIHVNNGAVKITKNGTDFIERKPDNENVFKELYPTHCLDYNYSQELHAETDISKTAPCFWHFIKGLVPTELVSGKEYQEKKDLYDECSMYIAQILAYTLSPTKPNEYFFGIQGGQETGKSFFIKLLKSIVGGKFCIERPIADMDNRFAASGFWGKKVFIEPDMKARSPLPDGFIKAYAGEQSITIERKNEQPIEDIKISLAIFLISNYDFVVKGIEGIARRFIYLPYKNRLENPDRTLLDKILGNCEKGYESGELAGQVFDERPAIFGLALRGWEKFRDNNFAFDVPSWAQDEKDRWMIDNSSTTAFIHEKLTELEGLDYKEDRIILYNAYDEWCKEEKRRPLGKKNFYEELRRIPGMEETRMGSIWTFGFKGIGDVPF